MVYKKGRVNARLHNENITNLIYGAATDDKKAVYFLHQRFWSCHVDGLLKTMSEMGSLWTLSEDNRQKFWSQEIICFTSQELYFFKIIGLMSYWLWPEVSRFIDWFWPSDAVWHHGPWSSLVQVMVCCLMAPSQQDLTYTTGQQQVKSASWASRFGQSFLLNHTTRSI